MNKHHNNNTTNSIINIILLILLSTIGVLMQYSAGNGDFLIYALPQLIKICISFFILFIIYIINIKFIFMCANISYILCLFLIIIVDLSGTIHLGAQRWIHFGSLFLQPSELMKISIIMMLAKSLSSLKEIQQGKLRNYIIPFFISFLPFLLILEQPDLGTSIIILGVTGIMFFVSGLRLRYFMLVFISGIIIAPLLWINLYDYQKQRILTFLNPERDPLGSGYHIIQSKIAIGSGGLIGKGFLNGSQSQLNFIPEKQTDFIFALFTEEFGFIGALILLLLYSGLIINNLILACKLTNNYYKLFIVGMVSIIFFHVFINIGMVSGLIPVVGVPLILLSFGGTSIISIMIGFGIILNISKNNYS